MIILRNKFFDAVDQYISLQFFLKKLREAEGCLEKKKKKDE